MIKIINCNKKNYLNNLTKFLDLRRSGKKNENKTISKILKFELILVFLIKKLLNELI